MGRYEELERRVRALENAGGDDAGYPSFITVAPDGSTSYDFNGHISADGIDFQEIVSGAADPPGEARVSWLDTADGLVASYVGAQFSGGNTHALKMYAGRDDSPDAGIAILRGRSNNRRQAYFAATGHDTAGDANLAGVVSDTPGSLTWSLLFGNELQEASYPVNNSGSRVKRFIHVGSSNVNSGAGGAVILASFAHGLKDVQLTDMTPVFAVIQPVSSIYSIGVTALGATTVSVAVQRIDGVAIPAATAINFYYLVVGPN